MEENLISNARSRIYALREHAPQNIKDVPPWVWVAVMGLVLLTIATVAVITLGQRRTD